LGLLPLHKCAEVVDDSQGTVAESILENYVEGAVHFTHVLILILESIFGIVVDLYVVDGRKCVSHYLAEHEGGEGKEFTTCECKH